MLLDEMKGFAGFTPGKTGMLGKFNRRLKPELGLAILPLNVHMHSRLFTREEVEAEASLTKNSRTHRRNDTRRDYRRPKLLEEPASGQALT